MIKILIADDSQTETELLKHIFQGEPDLEVVGYAKNGKEVCELTERLKPDIITMDILMPIMDGLDAIRCIMAKHPTPIVVISSKVNDDSLKLSFRALDAGALSVLEKPIYSKSSFAAMKKRILDTVRSMAEIKVVKRKYHLAKTRKKVQPSKVLVKQVGAFEIIAIGTSVGGPQVLKKILSKLPENFPVPIVVVQHMMPGFMGGFLSWLNENIALHVKAAEQGEVLKPGMVYFAPDNVHLRIARVEGRLTAQLVKSAPVAGFCPSATTLLNSVAEVSQQKGLGVLLTGMGSDGADGLLRLKQAKGHTIIQDEESAIVFGMAGVAQALGAVDKIVQLDGIADYLTTVTKKAPEKVTS